MSVYYKVLHSNHPGLEVRRAGRDHRCNGIMIQQGKRPGPWREAWMVAWSRRCSRIIHERDFFVANRIVPESLVATLDMFEEFLPTCMFCAIEAYGEYFDGALKRRFLSPVSDRRMVEIRDRLRNIPKEISEIVIDD